MNKVTELVVNIVLWTLFAVFFVVMGWMLRGLKARKEQVKV